MKVTTQTHTALECEPLSPEQQALPVIRGLAGDSTIMPQHGTPENQLSGPNIEAQATSSPANNTISPRCIEHARVWTPARREAVEAYISYLQRTLRLQDWTITIDWSKPTKKDALATMTQMSDSKHATLHLSPEFISEPPHLHGQILIHEMTHCHLYQMETLASTTVSALSDKRTTAVFNVA